MKKILEILLTLGLTTSPAINVLANGSPKETSQSNSENDLKVLLTGKLFLGSFNTNEEAKKNAQDLLKVLKVQDKVILSEPKNGKIHVQANDSSLTGEADFTYHIIQDINEILKNNLNLGYASSDQDAKIKALVALAKTKIQKKVTLTEPSNGKIHVQANFPSLKGETDFQYQISQEVNKLLEGQTDLKSVDSVESASTLAQKAIDKIPALKNKVQLSKPANGEILVSPTDQSLRGYATFTYLINQTHAKIPNNVSVNLKETHATEPLTTNDIANVKQEVIKKLKAENAKTNLSWKDAFLVTLKENATPEETTSVDVAIKETKSTGEKAGLIGENKQVNVTLKPISAGQAHAIIPKILPINLHDTSAGEDITSTKDINFVGTEVQNALYSVNNQASRNCELETFDVDTNHLTLGKIKVKVTIKATQPDGKKAGLIGESVEVPINILPMKPKLDQDYLVCYMPELRNFSIKNFAELENPQVKINDGPDGPIAELVNYDENTGKGQVKGLKPGRTTLTVSSKNTNDRITNIIVYNGEPDKQLKVDDENPKVTIGETVTIHFLNPNSLIDPFITYMSSDDDPTINGSAKIEINKNKQDIEIKGLKIGYCWVIFGDTDKTMGGHFVNIKVEPKEDLKP